MNDKDRTRIRKACTDCDRDVRRAIYIFGNEVEDMKYNEEGKIDNLPPQLRDSSKGDQLDDAVRQLTEVADKIEVISTALDDITDALGAESKFIAPRDAGKSLSPGRKGKSFHALFPESLLKELKVESARRGISMNEMVCRTLQNELEKGA
jgi:Ni,Fe-hydrogenase III large subunit